jgi:glycosyltransferase involved in cell wall biosynthesis
VHVEVLAPAAGGLAAREVLAGIPVHRFRYALRAWETLAYTGTMAETVARTWSGKVALSGYLVAQRVALRRTVQRFDAHLVHAHWWFPAGLSAATPASRDRRPLIVTMHGSDVRLAATRRWAHPLFRRVMRQASAVTTVSSWLARQVREMASGADPLVSPMPVATELFAPGSAPRQSQELLFVGRLNSQKGLHFLIDAMAVMRQQATLHVVGDGPDQAALQRQAQERGVLDRMTWHGALTREQLGERYRRAAAVIIPSRDEGLGLVAVEAQLSRAAVIAFASGGLTDVVEHERTGLLVPPGDVAALASALDRVVLDPSYRDALGQGGRSAALDRFSPTAVAARYADLYRAVLAR